MEEIFPRRDVDYSNLRLTPEGIYSVTRRRDADHILSIISTNVGNIKDKSITDATACVGGDTINFALNFREVHSIEYSKENYDALKNNISVYGLTNVNLYFGDCMKLYNWVSDVLYIDPPWGGPNYRNLESVELFLGTTRLDVWLEDILSGPYRPSFVFLKVPSNYHSTPLQFLPNVKSIRTFKIRSYVLVCVSVY
jgi:hypothetical protein